MNEANLYLFILLFYGVQMNSQSNELNLVFRAGANNILQLKLQDILPAAEC